MPLIPGPTPRECLFWRYFYEQLDRTAARCATRRSLLLFTCSAVFAQNPNTPIRNIVLVHGAWADASGWQGVYGILVRDGYHVSMVQQPETCFKEDVTRTKRVLALQDGPASWSLTVMAEPSSPKPELSEAQDGKPFPRDLSKSGAIKKTPDNFTYLDPAQFHDWFVANLSAERAAFMAQSQVFNLAENFQAIMTAPAWRSKPSWMLVAGADKTINPELERWYAARAKSHTVEVAGASHVVYVSHPPKKLPR